MMNSFVSHPQAFQATLQHVVESLPINAINHLATELSQLRSSNGRLYILGVGGSAANASHAVNDFRKLCGINAHCPTDNVAELTARTNDDGWERVFIDWLETSQLGEKDALLIFSVGGGDIERNVSVGIIHAIDYAHSVGSVVYSVVGKQDGYAARNSDFVIALPELLRPELLTPIAESYQAIIWHCLVSHPKLQTTGTKW